MELIHLNLRPAMLYATEILYLCVIIVFTPVIIHQFYEFPAKYLPNRSMRVIHIWCTNSFIDLSFLISGL